MFNIYNHIINPLYELRTFYSPVMRKFFPPTPPSLYYRYSTSSPTFTARNDTVRLKVILFEYPTPAPILTKPQAASVSNTQNHKPNPPYQLNPSPRPAVATRPPPPSSDQISTDGLAGRRSSRDWVRAAWALTFSFLESPRVGLCLTPSLFFFLRLSRCRYPSRTSPHPPPDSLSLLASPFVSFCI